MLAFNGDDGGVLLICHASGVHLLLEIAPLDVGIGDGVQDVVLQSMCAMWSC